MTPLPASRPNAREEPAGAGRGWEAERIAADPALVAEGWEPRFVADGRRAAEAAALYRQLGQEVRLEPLRPTELPEGCTDCQLVVLLHFRTVYTRRRPPDRGGS